MGERKVCVIANSYIYYGTYRGVWGGSVVLGDAYVIYDTGPWSDKEWKTAEYLGKEWAITMSHVESWGDTDKALPGQAMYPAGQEKACTPAPIPIEVGGYPPAAGEADLQELMIQYRYADELSAHDAYLKVQEFIKGNYGQPSRTKGETGAGSARPRGIGEGDVGVE